MKRNEVKRALSILLCLVSVLMIFTSCTKKAKEVSAVPEDTSQKALEWIIEPCIKAEKISALINADFNENTNHYDLNISKYFSVKYDGKCGLIDAYGCNVLDAKYDKIFAIRNGDDFIGLKGSAQTYIHSDSLQTEPAYRKYNSNKYEYYYNKSENKLMFAKNSSGDISARKVDIVLPEVVIGVKDNDYTADGTYGLYSGKKELTSMQYSYAGYFNDGVAAVKKGNKWGYIDSQGKTVIPFEMDAVKGYNAFSGEDTPYESSEGYVCVCQNGKFAYFTNKGVKLCDFIYDDATPCVNGRAYVLYDGKWGIVFLGEAKTVSDELPSTSRKTTTTTTATTTTTTSTQPETTAREDEYQYVNREYKVDVQTLFLRKDIESDYIITMLAQDETVTCDKISGGWAHLVFDGYDGWVKLEYLKEIPQD